MISTVIEPRQRRLLRLIHRLNGGLWHFSYLPSNIARNGIASLIFWGFCHAVRPVWRTVQATVGLKAGVRRARVACSKAKA
jgi:hypothetical protein